MKVDNSVKGTGVTASNSASRQRTGVVPSNDAETASTQVKISSLSSLGVDSVLANSPVTNPDKIAEIKQAMSNGQFTVNAEKIASGLIDSVRQMLAKPGSGV